MTKKSVNESTQNITEGFFGDILGSVKLAKDVAVYTKKMEKGLKAIETPEEMRELVRSVLSDVHDIVSKSNVSISIKNTFYASFLGGIYGKVKMDVLNGASGNDVQEFLGWPQDIYNIASRAYLGQDQPVFMDLGF